MKLPLDFKQRTSALLGADDYERLVAALQEEPPVSIRLNKAKLSRQKGGETFLVQYEPVAWCRDGSYLPIRPAFTFDPLFHAGAYYVQEASSMFLAHVLRTLVREPVKMLDLCAAPGGKSTLARSVLPEGSLLIANEVMRNRSHVLVENLIKWGHPDAVITRNDPADFSALPAFFDVMLTDMPCSGEGMFRKDAAAITDWSVETVNSCWRRQRKTLADAWPALKCGGLLIYSTCTFNKEENEENVVWIVKELGAEVLGVPVSSEWHITGNRAGMPFPVYRFLPYQTKGEGLFLAILRKTGEEKRGTMLPKKQKSGKPCGGIVPNDAFRWVEDADSYAFAVQGHTICATHKSLVDDIAWVQRYLHVLQSGLLIGETKGKDLVPNHSLAMSTALNAEAFACAEISYEQAVAYLRKETVTLDPSVHSGYVLLVYRGMPLGFVKNLGHRANNLYPTEWRIRSGRSPEGLSLGW